MITITAAQGEISGRDCGNGMGNEKPETTGTKSWNRRRLKEVVLPYIELYF